MLTFKTWVKKNSITLVWILLMCLVLFFGLVLNGKIHVSWLSRAHAQELMYDEELALAVAKVSANEASLARVGPADVALTYQAAEDRIRDPRARLAWLRAHSSCVLTDRAMTEEELRGNCVWSRNLGATTEQPEGWPTDLQWEPYFSRRWAQVNEYARRLVSGRDRFRPCTGGRVFTWGGPMDHARALERGLRPLRCVDRAGVPLLNTGYALALDGS